MINIKTPEINIRTAETRERLAKHSGRAYKHTRTTSAPKTTKPMTASEPMNPDIQSKSLSERRREVNSRVNPDSVDRSPNYKHQAEIIGLTAMTLIASPAIVDGLGFMGEQVDKSDPANHIVIPIEVQNLPSNPADLTVTVVTHK